MTVKELKNKLDQFDPNLPVCINDYIGFVEASEESIKVEQKKYICFPFTECDEFAYVNLKGKQFDI